MGSYLFRRLLNLIPILIGISFLSFVLINLSPSDPAEVAVRVNEVTPTEEVLAETRAKLGLDKPFLTRYVAWLNNSLHGDFGNRYVDDKPVLGEIQKALPATLVLAGAALCLTLVCSLSAGIVCASAMTETRFPCRCGTRLRCSPAQPCPRLSETAQSWPVRQLWTNPAWGRAANPV